MAWSIGPYSSPNSAALLSIFSLESLILEIHLYAEAWTSVRPLFVPSYYSRLTTSFHNSSSMLLGKLTRNPHVGEDNSKCIRLLIIEDMFFLMTNVFLLPTWSQTTPQSSRWSLTWSKVKIDVERPECNTRVLGCTLPSAEHILIFCVTSNHLSSLTAFSWPWYACLCCRRK